MSERRLTPLCRIQYFINRGRRDKNLFLSPSFPSPSSLFHFSFPFRGSRGRAPSGRGSGELAPNISWILICDLVHSGVFWRQICGSPVSTFVNNFYQRWGGGTLQVGPLNTLLIDSTEISQLCVLRSLLVHRQLLLLLLLMMMMMKVIVDAIINRCGCWHHVAKQRRQPLVDAFRSVPATIISQPAVK